MGSSVTMSDISETSRPVRVGVLLRRSPVDLGEWLADAAAFDAAGADALWIDPAPDTGLDPLAVTAGLATVTFRSLLVTPAPQLSGRPEARARTLTTVSQLSRGRLALFGEHGYVAEVTASLPVRADVAIFHRIDDASFERAGTDGAPERWVRTAVVDGRPAWRAAIADAAGRGIGGLLVPAEVRLLDILRNPDDRGDRRDLQLAQG
jgi:hypothetical protein